MGHIQTYASVLSTEELATRLNQDRERWHVMLPYVSSYFLPHLSMYVYIK